MFEKYIDVRNWLENFIPLVYGKEELGLVRIENLLKLLGNPERKFKSIHVAGTSGKGSTAFYISKMLQLSVLGSQSSDESQSVSQLSDKPKTGRPKSDFPKENLSNRKQKTDNWKIGLHISPHLVDIRERMQIFGGIGESEESEDRRVGGIRESKDRRNQRIGRSEESENRKIGRDENLMPMGRFLKLFKQVRPVVEKIQKEKPELTPSYFEILVAAAFKYFAEEKVDWAVVEVGLGGRLDATNVLIPEVSVITNIGLDHTEILGDTIEKIAFEKAGIIKEGVPVVTGATGEALIVIEKVAKEKGAEVVRVGGIGGIREIGESEKSEGRRIGISENRNVREVNLEIAMKVVELALESQGTTLPYGKEAPFDSRRNLIRWFLAKQGASLLNVQFPGRFEEIEKGVILDGAHNPDKIRALLEFMGNKKQETGIKKQENILRESVSESRSRNSSRPFGLTQGKQARTIIGVTLVLAFKKGKDWETMVALLIKNLPIQSVIATEFQAVTDTGRFGTVPAEEIAKYIRDVYSLSCIVHRNSQQAVFEALRFAQGKLREDSRIRFWTSQNDRSLVLVTGSLYLVGEVRTLWYLPEF